MKQRSGIVDRIEPTLQGFHADVIERQGMQMIGVLRLQIEWIVVNLGQPSRKDILLILVLAGDIPLRENADQRFVIQQIVVDKLLHSGFRLLSRLDAVERRNGAFEKAKADEMVESFVEILNNELTAIYKEDDVSEYRFDVREKIVNVLQKPLEEHLTEILQLCHYDNYRGSRFDVDSCDVVVNGSDKLSQGKGFRAFLNSVMALAVQEVLNDYNLHKTNLLVMDSPILSLKEREENVGTQVTSDSMRSGLFQYMINRQEIAQIIILENDVPNLDYSTAHCIHFTKKEKDGRYGLIEGYRD